jgi:hypothetical protein
VENELDENFINKDSPIPAKCIADSTKVHQEEISIREDNIKLNDDKSLYESFRTFNKYSDSCFL